MRRLVAALVLATSTALPGCSMINYGQFDPLASGRAFDDTQVRFNRLVRWGQWKKAAEMVAVDQREEFLTVGQALTDVRFTDWDVVTMEMGDGLEKATVEVRIEGYRDSTLTHHAAVMVQEWERLEGVTSPWVVRPRLDELKLAFVGR
ncbi:MAG TPA: hypothetical protein VHQ66_05005 [Myxococcota bacterium]|jgi:hypothetical protein|nr:hypothetical protein [Myxococcota bacterium]